MNRRQNTYRRPAPRGWRERWMQRFGMNVNDPYLKGGLTVPNWLSGKSIVFFFVATFACFGAFGYEPDFDLILVSSISVVLFFYGSMSMSKGWSQTNEKKFVRNVFVAAFVVRLIWILYCYFVFYPDHYGSTYGDGADTDWYMDYAKDIAQWLGGQSQYSFVGIMQRDHSAIDDTGYPMWLAIGYLFWGGWSDIFMPYIIKSIVSAYCAVCIYHVAKRHFGEGTARMAAIFVALNPNMIYWCGTMMKEAEMVFLCCVFIDEVDKALSTNRFTLKDLWLGLLAGFALFFFRAALGIAAFMAVFAHIIFVSNRVLATGKKILAGLLVVITLMVGMGESLRTKTETIFANAQSTEIQQKNMEWRAERKGGNKFAEYAGAAVFAPLIFTIPFPTFNQALENQYTQMQLSGGSYIKNILSFFVVMVMILMLISGDWRRHVFIIAYTCGYLAVLVLSSFAQSGRFHMPIMPMLMLFAAYGIQIAKGRPRFRRMFTFVLIAEVLVCLVWNWFKLAGRGMV